MALGDLFLERLDLGIHELEDGTAAVADEMIVVGVISMLPELVARGAAIELMGQHDALSDTIERSRHYGAIARDALGLFPDSEIKRALTGLIDFCIDRAY